MLAQYCGAVGNVMCREHPREKSLGEVFGNLVGAVRPHGLDRVKVVVDETGEHFGVVDVRVTANRVIDDRVGNLGIVAERL